LRLNPIEEGPIWDKVKKTAAAGAIAGAAGYGALTGQFAKDEPARAPTEITIPGGDLEQQKPAVKKEKEKLTPSTATNADPKMEQLVFVTALRSGIKGKELAQFMAQVAHETLGFQRLVEVGSKEYFNRYDPEHNPKKAKILGNVKKGDGLRYKGRGFIQITGRENYRRAGQALGLPLEEKPDLASRPDVAARIAVWYWASRVKPNVANFNDTRAVTQRINPKLNGLTDRHENFKDYKNMFIATRTGT
jgi:predicted chitinase